MGARGPKPTPTAILKLHGSRLAKSRRGEPKPPAGRPTCPSWMPKAAKAAWRQLLPLLEEMGVLSRIDGNALERYCVMLARWREAERVLTEKGSTIEVKDAMNNVKYVAQRPEVAIAKGLAVVLARLEAAFGLTPADRARINIKPDETPPRVRTRSRQADAQ